MANSKTEQLLINAVADLKGPGSGGKPTDCYRAQQWEMAAVHATVINGLLNIYQQAPLITKQKSVDFAGYALFWTSILDHHHRFEETTLFPLYGPTFELNTIISEHEAFHTGLSAMEEYLVSCLPAGTPYPFDKVAPSQEAVEFDGNHLRSIIDSFAEPLITHLGQEVQYLDAKKLRASGLTEAEMRAIEKATEKMVKSLPLLTFLTWVCLMAPEWAEFPPVPAVIRKGLVPYVFTWFNRNYWQFVGK